MHVTNMEMPERKKPTSAATDEDVDWVGDGASRGTRKVTDIMRQTKIGGTIVHSSSPTYSRLFGHRLSSSGLVKRCATGAASRTKMCAMVRMHRENTTPLAAIPVSRYRTLLRPGTAEGIPIASTTFDTPFVPDCRIAATSVQKTTRSMRLRNSLSELSLMIFSKAACSANPNLSS